MWFVARTRGYATVILDEPDVYMHADLQRKLIRLLRNRYPQIVIAATHGNIQHNVGNRADVAKWVVQIALLLHPGI